MQVSDDIFLGPVSIPGPLNTGNPAPMELGVGPVGRVYVFDVVPLTLQVAGLAAVQLLGAAGNFTLAAGTGVTSRTRADGTVEYVLDTPRCLTATVATTDQSAVNLTFSGYDQYGQPMTETIAGPNANTVAGRKAFKTVTRVAASAAVATNGISIGFNDKLGMPFRVPNAVHVISVKWASTLAADAGTFVAADATSPATASTTDVRGCYTPSSAADGAKRLIMAIALTALAAGPQATRIGAVGVTQA